MKLSATRVRALRDPGRYSDGDGLHLFIHKNGRKSWVQRITVDGRRRDIGLGGYPTVSLAQARKRATDNREAIGSGRDPVAEKHRPAMPTFSEAAHTVHEANKPRWRNGSHTSAWIQTLERHAFPKIGNKKIDTVSRTDVLTVLAPIWSTRPETGRRVRQRMRTIFRWAMANELIETNPAGEAIDGALAINAQGQGASPGASLPGGGCGSRDRRCIPDVTCFEALSEVPDSHGGTIR